MVPLVPLDCAEGRIGFHSSSLEILGGPSSYQKINDVPLEFARIRRAFLSHPGPPPIEGLLGRSRGIKLKRAAAAAQVPAPQMVPGPREALPDDDILS